MNMSPRCFLTLIVLFGAWFLPAAGVAAYDCPFAWEPVTDADWTIAEDTVKGIHDAVIILERVNIDDSEIRRFSLEELLGNRSYRSLYRRVRILSDAGRSEADVDVPVFHWNQKIDRIQARTILRDGTIITMQPDQIHVKEVIKTDDEKVKQTSFSLPGVTDDCIIEYIIVCKTPYSSVSWPVQKERPVLKFSCYWKLANAKLDLEVYDYVRSDPTLDFTIPNYLWLNPRSAQKITPLPDEKKPEGLSFETQNVPAFKEEPWPMPDNFLKERLVCYYGSDVSPMTYWGSWGLSTRLAEFCSKNKKVKQLITQFESLPDTTTRIQAAYDWVQSHILNLTYLDLRDKKDSTKLIEGEPRNSVDDILKLGYATRPEIDNLFWEILRELGVDAKFVYAQNRTEDLFVENAKYWQFDRTAVAVPLSKTNFQFYTPGHPCTPAGLIPWYLEGVTCLMPDADEYLMTIPFSEAPTTTIKRGAQITFTDDLEVKSQMRAEYTGQEARILRMAIFDEDSSTHFDNLKDEIDDGYGGAEFESITFEGFDSIYQPFVLNLNAKYPPVAPVGDRILLKPCDYMSEAKNDFVKADRVGPVLFRNAYTLQERADFSLPTKWKLDALPDDTTYRNKVGQCEVRFIGTADGFSVTRAFTLTGPYWLVSDYASMRRLFQVREDMSERIVVLKSDGNAGVSK
jgi:hypothetical protein